jgi:hypothetical protein
MINALSSASRIGIAGALIGPAEGQTTMVARSDRKAVGILALGSLLAVLCGQPAAAQQEAAVLAGVQYLRSRASTGGPGEAAMMALGMIKAEVPASDPALAAALAKVYSRFTSSEYAPSRGNGQGPYEAGATAMALAGLDAAANRGKLALIVNYLTRTQNANGSWDYTGRPHGDSSITQYGVLGLWEAENSGVEVAPAVWERIASWYMSTQFGDGSWVYHHDEPTATGGPTISMTAAGVGSLLICRRQLERYRQDARAVSPLLTSLATETNSDYKPSINFKDMDKAITQGMSWISSHWTTSMPTVGRTPYYTLYGIERIGALAERQTIGRLDWFEKGRAFIRQSQSADGSWNGEGGPEVNTAWAMLFLTKSTAKTLRRIQIQRLGAGTLLGGRGLPKDLTSMTVAGGRVVSRPMNGAIEGMLTVLEDPRAEQADAAVAGIVDNYYHDGPKALRPHKARFLKMLADRDPGVRRVAAWTLAHTGDMDIIPALIETLRDPDEDVVDAARLGLQTISRKIDGLGPPRPSTAEQRKEAAARWLDWYTAIKPLDLDDEDNPDRRGVPGGQPAVANDSSGASPTAAGTIGSPKP